MSDFNYIKNHPFTSISNRTLGRQYEPASVKETSLRLIYGTDGIISTTATVANNTANTFHWIVDNNASEGAMMMQTNYEIYIGATDDLNNLLPGGSNVSHSGWRILGPVRSKYEISGRAVEDYENVERLTIINTTGSSHNVTIYRFAHTVINNPSGVVGNVN